MSQIHITDLSAPLEVDDTALEREEAPDVAQYTVTKANASVSQAFTHRDGRRYHAFEEDAYLLPNDEIEAARLDLQHHVWKIALDGALTRVPITDMIKNVLDIGTGTGIWAIEFAKAFPGVQVTGTDLSPIQPDFVPPNCHFFISNAELPWTFTHKFDYIHARMLTLGVHDWPRFFEQCWEHLAPGGWLETYDTQFPPRRADGDAAKDSVFLRWGEGIYEAAAKAGLDARASVKFGEQLTAQGFANVEKVEMQWPIRSWAKGQKYKAMGRLMYENILQALPAVGTTLFVRHLGWTKQQVDECVAECVTEVDDESNHFYFPMCLYRAQKPETTT